MEVKWQTVNTLYVPCRVVRDGLGIDGQVYAAGVVVRLNPTFAADLERDGDVDRLDKEAR